MIEYCILNTRFNSDPSVSRAVRFFVFGNYNQKGDRP